MRAYKVRAQDHMQRTEARAYFPEIWFADKKGEKAHLFAQPTLFSYLLSSERQSEDCARKGILHIAAKHLEGAALIWIFAQQVCLGEVCSHARVDCWDWQIGAVGVKVDNGWARHKGGDICQVVAWIEANPANTDFKQHGKYIGAWFLLVFPWLLIAFQMADKQMTGRIVRVKMHATFDDHLFETRLQSIFLFICVVFICL